MSKNNKPRIAHITLNFGCSSGIINKLEDLAKSSTLNNLGIDFFCLPCYDYNLSKPKYLNLVKLDDKNKGWKRLYYRFMQINFINKIAPYYQKIVLRYTMVDPIVLLFLKNKKKIYFEHHGKEIVEMKKTGDFRHIFEKHFGGWFLRRFAGSVSVTSDILEYEKRRRKNQGKALLFPNSLSFDNLDFSALDFPVWDSKVLHLGFVANFWPWHGLDKVLNSFKRHPELSEKVVLHLVGQIKNKQDKKLAQSLGNVEIYGNKSKEWLAEFYPKINIGLGSFSMDLLNISQSSSLKIRENLKMGIPVVLGTSDISFSNKFFAFICEFDLQKVYDFALQFQSTLRSQVARAAQPYIDSKVILEKLRKDILSI